MHYTHYILTILCTILTIYSLYYALYSLYTDYTMHYTLTIIMGGSTASKIPCLLSFAAPNLCFMIGGHKKISILSEIKGEKLILCRNAGDHHNLVLHSRGYQKMVTGPG